MIDDLIENLERVTSVTSCNQRDVTPEPANNGRVTSVTSVTPKNINAEIKTNPDLSPHCRRCNSPIAWHEEPTAWRGKCECSVWHWAKPEALDDPELAALDEVIEAFGARPIPGPIQAVGVSFQLRGAEAYQSKGKVRCRDCRHWRPDQVGDGHGIGHCLIDAWKPGNGPPPYPNAIRFCDNFNEVKQ